MSNTVTEIGSCEAIINSIKTRVDGSISLTLEINPHDSELVNRLMRLYLEDKKLVTCAFVRVE